MKKLKQHIFFEKKTNSEAYLTSKTMKSVEVVGQIEMSDSLNASKNSHTIPRCHWDKGKKVKFCWVAWLLVISKLGKKIHHLHHLNNA